MKLIIENMKPEYAEEIVKLAQVLNTHELVKICSYLWREHHMEAASGKAVLS